MAMNVLKLLLCDALVFVQSNLVYIKFKFCFCLSLCVVLPLATCHLFFYSHFCSLPLPVALVLAVLSPCMSTINAVSVLHALGASGCSSQGYLRHQDQLSDHIRMTSFQMTGVFEAACKGTKGLL